MSSIPSNLSRVPTYLSSQFMLGSLNRTNTDLLNLQLQMGSGKSVNRPSDNVIAASTVSVLEDIMERREQRLRNLTHAESVLNNIDHALADATDMLLEAKSIALSQIGVGSDPATRETSAAVIDAMVSEMIGIANRQYQQVHLFGGRVTSAPPISGLLGGWYFGGTSDGLFTDLGLLRSVPITVSANEAFGAMSSRVEGDTDLDPIMIGSTRLQDLRGARGFGVSLGTVDVTISDGGSQTQLSVDLSDAHSVQDVVNTLQNAIQTADPDVTVQIDPDSNNRFQIIPGGGVTITINDPVGDAVAADLGIRGVFDAANTLGEDVDPKLTELTPISSLSTVPPALKEIRLTNGHQVRDLDLSGAMTIQDIMMRVEALNIGIRVEISKDGDRLNFVNALSGHAMSIGEVDGGTSATQLGVRSFAPSTLLADFNHGLGVQILSGNVDPVTGQPDPSLDMDFRITLKNGDFFDVDIAGATTVQDVIDAINEAANTSGVASVPALFEASLAPEGNGFVLIDNTPGTTTSVTALNGSYAAQDLGILGSTESATLVGEDRATVAVNSVFSHLMSLREALRVDDERGISLAVSKLERDIDRLARTRGEVGARTQRVMDARLREEDLQLQDESLKSQVQDLDFTNAAMRFALLQQQLQAGLQTASLVSSMSLLDFLR